MRDKSQREHSVEWADRNGSRVDNFAREGSTEEVAIKRTAQVETAALMTESLDYHEVKNEAETKRQVPKWFITRSVLG